MDATAGPMIVTLLGPVALLRPDGREGAVAGARQRILLARLALDAPRLVTSPALVDALWAGEPPAGAGNALQSQVSRLRRALRGVLPDGAAEPLVSSAAGYRLALAPSAVDTGRFERLVARGRAVAGDEPDTAVDLLRQADRLWRGPALGDLAEVPFAAAAARGLEQLRLDAAETRLRLDVTRGRAATTIDELTRLVADHPLRESLCAVLLEALARCGRAAQALAVFDQTRRALAEELGTDPSPVLRAAHLAVLRGSFTDATDAAGSPAGSVRQPDRSDRSDQAVRTDQADVTDQADRSDRSDQVGAATPGAGPSAGPIRGVSTAAERTWTIPAPLTRLVGRETELDMVTGLLARHRLVTLTGPGGAGKTRLAMAGAARAQALADREGPIEQTLFVELAGAREVGEIDHAVLAALGRPGMALRESGTPALADGPGPGGARPGRGSLLTALRRRQVLLVLDNCEHLIDAAAAVVDEILRRCPGVRVLVRESPASAW